LALGLDWHSSLRCLVGAGFLVGAVLALPAELNETLPVAVIAFHLAAFASLLIGALFDDRLARLLRLLASMLLVAASFAVMMGRADAPGSTQPMLPLIYPLGMTILLAGYGQLFGQRASLVGAALILAGWLSLAGWRGYCWLRQMVLG